jgi:hypothetical protein
MATFYSNTLTFSTQTNAEVQANIQFIIDALTNGGWIQTSDTGQINVGSVTATNVNNHQYGYVVFRMNDALQTTAPVFIKIVFANGSNQLNSLGVFSVFLFIGQGSDGSGNLTGVRFNNGGALGSSQTVSAVSGWGPGNIGSALTPAGYSSFGSVASNRCAFNLFNILTGIAGSPGYSPLFFFSIERSKNSSGQDTTDGLIVIYRNAAEVAGAFGRITDHYGINRVAYVKLATGPQPPIEPYCSFLLPFQISATYDGKTGVGLMIPFAGVAQNPGYNVAAVRAVDFTAESTFTLNVYGNPVTYIVCNNNFPVPIYYPTPAEYFNSGAGSARYSGVVVAMRYD